MKLLFFPDEGMSADYRLRHLVNNVAIHMITLEWR